MLVETLVPARGEAELEELADRLAARPSAPPFAPELIDFCHALSRALFADPRARRHPELVPLAAFLRRASATALAREFAAGAVDGVVQVPRGLAFHVPPSSVDTMFVYSLAVSLLVGNRNVVRLSQRRSETTEVLVDALNAVAAEHPQVGDSLAVVSYGHELEPSAVLSRAADVRVIWGGDATIETIRSLPLAPHATELLFGDRFSLAALDAATPEDDLARRLFNDAYWFDQMGCSSPRLVVGVGAGARERLAALFDELRAEIDRRGYALELGAALAKRAYAYGALADRPVRDYRELGNELTVIELETLDGFDRTHPGAGLFYAIALDALDELAGHVVRKDQTMTVSGFDDDTLARFVRAVNGRGIDRIVPFGEALAFGRFWDGYDLLAELTRRVHRP
ncbi:MAG: gamma-glutamyl phosphate reductase [Solirubrobacteraceae bacterium]|nr:gamma-glutamyl phosphate reductase [Solirubrobacteraceae bacterium]